MIAIRTVVCPVDFSPATPHQLNLAADVCRAFGARLVVHHNVTDLSVGAGVGWMWHADHAASEPAVPVDDQLRALVGRIPKEVSVETCITRGAVTEGVLAVSDAAEADVVVVSTHRGKAEDHASVIEYLLERSGRAVLALHDPGADVSRPRFVYDDEHYAVQPVLVPTNLSRETHTQVEFACDLARLFPVRLHLLHVIEPQVARQAEAIDPASVTSRLGELVPNDLVGRAALHSKSGDTVPVIVETARDIGAAFIVMGEHTRVPVKRWLTHDTSRAVLHRASCPVWYVPSPAAAATGRAFRRFALSNEKSILWGNV